MLEFTLLTRTVILLVCRLIVACGVGLDSLLDLLNGTAQEVCLAHLRTSTELYAALLLEYRVTRVRVASANEDELML